MSRRQTYSPQKTFLLAHRARSHNNYCLEHEHGLFAKQEANARRKSFSMATPRPAVSIVLFDLILSRYYLKEVSIESNSLPNTTLASLTQNPHSHFSSLFCVGCVS